MRRVCDIHRSHAWGDAEMSEEIVRRKSPDVGNNNDGGIKPEDYNPEMAAASLARDLVNKLPTPAIDTRKFTIIHGLMQSMDHTDTNKTYIDTKLIIELMDRVSEKSVNVDGKYFTSLFAYLMKPKYIIQGMPTTPIEEQKPGLLSRLWAGIRGKPAQPEAGKT